MDGNDKATYFLLGTNDDKNSSNSGLLDASKDVGEMSRFADMSCSSLVGDNMPNNSMNAITNTNAADKRNSPFFSEGYTPPTKDKPQHYCSNSKVHKISPTKSIRECNCLPGPSSSQFSYKQDPSYNSYTSKNSIFPTSKDTFYFQGKHFRYEIEKADDSYYQTSKKRKYTHWAKEETMLVRNYFYSYFMGDEDKSLPGKNEIKEFLRLHPRIKYPWFTVRTKVMNDIQLYKMKELSEGSTGEFHMFPKRSYTHWAKEDTKLIREYFDGYFTGEKAKALPGKEEIEDFLMEYPRIKYPWFKVKTKVMNDIKLYKVRHNML